MARIIRIANVGPGLLVQGGISRVISMIKGNLPDRIDFRLISTFTKFTGDKGATPSERGSRLGQAGIFLFAFTRILLLAIGRRTAFHVHFAGRGSLLRKGVICILLRLLGCQYAVHSHAAGTDLFQPWLPIVFRRMILWGIGGAGRVIVLTRFWHDYYSSLLGLTGDRLLVLPNPADLPPSIPSRPARQNVRLLFLGRIGARKGAFDIVRALAALPDHLRSRCHLTLAGDGEIDEIRRLASELDCLDQVSSPGWVAKQDVDSLLAESDVLILPSHAEGMAMALVEGMSWGLPVVTTVAGGAGEFLEHGCNCMLVTPGDVSAIKHSISELVQNPALRQRLGAAARSTISQFSIENYVHSLTALYVELASRHSHFIPTEVAGFTPNHDSPPSFVSRSADLANSEKSQ
jgi:glycosyltransferase involved in cell wall biosynthesis